VSLLFSSPSRSPQRKNKQKGAVLLLHRPRKKGYTDFAVFPYATRCGSTDGPGYHLPPTDHDIGFLKLQLHMLFRSRADVAFLRRLFFDLVFLFISLFLSLTQAKNYLPVLCRTLRPTFFTRALQLRPSVFSSSERASMASYSFGSNPYPYGIILISPFFFLRQPAFWPIPSDSFSNHWKVNLASFLL
jgi:hypothetical protein